MSTNQIETKHSPVRVTPDKWADWLLRTWLPVLLEAAGDTRFAVLVREQTPLTADVLGNSYTLAKITHTLRTVRGRLDDAYAAQLSILRSLSRTPEPSRGMELFPYLKEICASMPIVLPAANTGRLLQVCVERAIALIHARQRNHLVENPFPALALQYDIALRELLKQTKEGATPS